jgi:hypothetical protein
MYAVRGLLNGVVYTLVVNREDPDTTATDGVTGSAPIVDLLTERLGEQVWATPTGPTFTLDLTDDRSILAALTELTTVTEMTGDVPIVMSPEVAGAIY